MKKKKIICDIRKVDKLNEKVKQGINIKKRKEKEIENQKDTPHQNGGSF